MSKSFVSQHLTYSATLRTEEHKPIFPHFLTNDNLTIKALKRAEHVCIKGEAIIWIEGDIGVGKTLLSNLIREQHARHHYALPYRHQEVRLTKEWLISPQLQQCESLTITIPSTTTLEELKTFYHFITEQNPKTSFNLLCLVTLSARHYPPDILRYLGIIKHSCIHQQHSYITLPPLHIRRHDTMLLTYHYLKLFSQHTTCALPDEIVALLQAAEWKQNVKDIQYFCMMLAHEYDINAVSKQDVEYILNAVQQRYTKLTPPCSDTAVHLQNEDGTFRVLEQIEHEIIAKACRHYNGSKELAARDLGIGRTTLYRKLK